MYYIIAYTNSGEIYYSSRDKIGVNIMYPGGRNNLVIYSNRNKAKKDMRYFREFQSYLSNWRIIKYEEN